MLEQELIDTARRFGMRLYHGMLRADTNGLNWDTDGDRVKNLHGVYFLPGRDTPGRSSTPDFYSILDAIRWAVRAVHELKAHGKRYLVFPYIRGDGEVWLEVAVYMNGKRNEFVDRDGVFEAFMRGEIPHEVVYDWIEDNNHLAVTGTTDSGEG